MTYTNQPVSNVYALTPMQEALADALTVESETYGDTYAYAGEDARYVDESDVKDADQAIVWLDFPEGRWETRAGASDPE